MGMGRPQAVKGWTLKDYCDNGQRPTPNSVIAYKVVRILGTGPTYKSACTDHVRYTTHYRMGMETAALPGTKLFAFLHFAQAMDFLLTSSGTTILEGFCPDFTEAHRGMELSGQVERWDDFWYCMHNDIQFLGGIRVPKGTVYVERFIPVTRVKPI